ncbi:uncharacterized protein N7473_002103 [Penicillium subrubescens]|jgi:hypothetical protein|uniref:Telomere maintenance protein SDE2 n=1 Tax=Penicillium subrubescens TaxID=1316194 RepID=A0A1Q5UFM0_9EURO|nr:uncharacterized protein N7473_002103 [Penicillium subrubescens]KAJ5905187.1 hypothetical protein N7473_002103 [Penicillium subrubescens]OKP11271.1 Telomere maintenance protein SDE2 [Penicillium subrubescens]
MASIDKLDPTVYHLYGPALRLNNSYNMAQSNINVLLSSFPGLSLPSTLSFALPSVASVSDLTDKVSSYLPTSLSLERLILTTTNNKQIFASPASLQSLISSDNGSANTILPIRLSAPMCGGKGGFGSQLRAAGGRMASKRKRNQGDNNSSSRNLDGRRLRTVNEAKALAEYLAVKPEMDKQEKEERRRRWQAVVEMAEKRQDEIKNGGGKQKIDGQWMDDKEEMNEKAREAVLLAMKDGAWTDNLRDAILGGSSTSASEGSEHASSSGSEEDDEEEENNGASSSSAVPSTSAAKPAPRRFIGFDDDDEFMSDSEDEADESDSKGKGKARA